MGDHIVSPGRDEYLLKFNRDELSILLFLLNKCAGGNNFAIPLLNGIYDSIRETGVAPANYRLCVTEDSQGSVLDYVILSPTSE